MLLYFEYLFICKICKLNPVNERVSTINVASTAQCIQVDRCRPCSGVNSSLSTGGLSATCTKGGSVTLCAQELSL